jgi:hypothetical protein
MRGVSIARANERRRWAGAGVHGDGGRRRSPGMANGRLTSGAGRFCCSTLHEGASQGTCARRVAVRLGRIEGTFSALPAARP